MSDLSNTVKPGDNLNTAGFHMNWRQFFGSLLAYPAVKIIVNTQKDVFCQTISDKKIWIKDSHSVMYFNDKYVFSVEMPKPKFIPLSTYEGRDKRIVSVYRLNPEYFKKEIKGSDTTIMFNKAIDIVNLNKGYDIGQLVDILITTIAGYPNERKVNWFDQGSQRMVCSVSIATIIAAWRHEVLKVTGIDIPQPWKVLNPLAWKDEFIKKWNGHWDIGTTFPANFAVTNTHFNNEFILVGKFKGGKRIA